jgi:hypothetical protein
MPGKQSYFHFAQLLYVNCLAPRGANVTSLYHISPASRIGLNDSLHLPLLAMSTYHGL